MTWTEIFRGRRAPAAARLAPDAAYARWAKLYPPRPHNLLMEAEHAAVLDLLPIVAGRDALDAGCGTGRYLTVLVARGARALGVDASEAMLERARSTWPRVVRGDVRALPVRSASMDIVVCGLALGDVPELPAAIGELARVLRPGGSLVYSVVHPDGSHVGWSRSFDADGRTWEIETSWHSVGDHHRAVEAAGLAIDARREPRLAGPHGERAVALVIRAVRRG